MSHVRSTAQPTRLLSHGLRRSTLRSSAPPRRRYATQGNTPQPQPQPHSTPKAQAETHSQPEFIGPADNPFNRERAAVKEHADKSAGKFLLSMMMMMDDFVARNEEEERRRRRGRRMRNENGKKGDKKTDGNI